MKDRGYCCVTIRADTSLHILSLKSPYLSSAVFLWTVANIDKISDQLMFLSN